MTSWRAHPEYERLFASSPSETAPLLLALARSQAARRRARDLLDQFRDDRFATPAALGQPTRPAFGGIALAARPEFEGLLLSPVAPLGSCSSLAPTSQDRTLSAARGLEVVSDPTNVLALECARRLANRSRTE